MFLPNNAIGLGMREKFAAQTQLELPHGKHPTKRKETSKNVNVVNWPENTHKSAQNRITMQTCARKNSRAVGITSIRGEVLGCAFSVYGGSQQGHLKQEQPQSAQEGSECFIPFFSSGSRVLFTF